MRTSAFEPSAAIVYLALFAGFWLTFIGGWIANIVKIFAAAGDPITAFFVIRCVGVFIAPVGAVLGFL